MKKLGLILKNLLFTLIVIIIFLIFVEIIFRIFNYPPYYKFNPGIYESDEILGHRLKKNLKGTQGRISIRTNKYGFRDDFNEVNDEQVRKIIVLGDSFAFGFGVEQEDSFPEQLEGLLSRKYNHDFEVINTGVPGYATIQEYKLLKQIYAEFQPDLVILEVCGNDNQYPLYEVDQNGQLTYIDRESRGRGVIPLPLEWKVWFRSNCSLYRFLSWHYDKILRTFRVRKGHSEYYRGSLEWDKPFFYIDKMITIARKNEAEFIIFTTAEPDNELFQSMKKRFDTAQVSYPKYWSDEINEIALPYDGHPNAKGHKIMAEILAEKIEKLGIFDKK